MRTRPGWVEPEVYFRIVHMALRDQSGPDTYRQQTVEIALGPKDAFKNGNIGTLARRVLNSGVVSPAPVPRGNPKPPKEPKIPRVVELLRKAIEWRGLLESGQIASQADIAHREGITRARVTQVMGLMRLAPEIQEHLLSMPNCIRRPSVSERMLRPIGTIADSRAQVLQFHKLLASTHRLYSAGPRTQIYFYIFQIRRVAQVLTRRSRVLRWTTPF
jgi:hypothetical protein